MIHDEICTYEVCKLAKEKGFPQQYDSLTHIYGGEDSFNVGIDLKYKKSEGTLFDIIEWSPCLNDIAAPTQSLLQRWLREEKGVVIEAIAYPTCSNNKKNCYWWSIKQNSDGICYQYEECSDILYGFGFAFDTYELALEDALDYSLKNLV